jgi:hypothetical protein
MSVSFNTAFSSFRTSGEPMFTPAEEFVWSVVLESDEEIEKKRR